MKYDKWMISIALVVSVIALILAWSAYNRSGLDLETQAEITIENDIAELERATALAEARIRLTALRAAVAAEDFSDEIADEVNQIQEDLRTAYEDTEGEIYEDWQEMDSDLEELEYQIRSGSADALDTLDDTIAGLKGDIRRTPKERCADAGGEWTQFPNTCVDLCEYERNPGEIICGQALTMGCECGADSCWNGITCEPV